ncbi:hypothetical protein INT47_012703 [Mucor saturninus]|uniref:Uncharacterized protein n=1 Tax=Mucor saturninus TaxID=64648 RepID=A0A8H7R4K2_9FUNG|nr:hypothetical protein INT47_012703 [Mucor saturninus]
MQDYKETDTVQDLYNEIEHLIDIPFEATCQSTQYKDFHYKQESEEPRNDYTFERPILIESDSDDIEEELPTPDQYCNQCDRPITSNQSLTVANNICHDCSSSSATKKPRSRSGSFTFTQIADKLKQSFGHSSSSNTLLAPGVKPVDRRKSMPTMDSLFDQQPQQLEPPSPVPSRPSSRASSFIEDVKQFLAPLSRKSSRNSMYQDYQQSSDPVLQKKSSHHSLLDAINICKPAKVKQAPSYERRIIQSDDTHNWSREDDEVMGIHQNNSWIGDAHSMENTIVPLRRKQIKKIESRQERTDIYINAYIECMKVETNLVPWIIKQTQKGPPDAWFGYTPPVREPKKIMGIFKRKPKENSNNLRAQQQQLGDDLLNRSTPLLQHRYSNSNLSASPSSFVYALDDQQVTSPVAMGYEEDQAYFEDQNYTPSLTTSLSPNSSTAEHAPRSSSLQPVSILKKKTFDELPQDEYDDTYYNDAQADFQTKTDFYQQPVKPKKDRKQRTSSGYDQQQMMMMAMMEQAPRSNSHYRSEFEHNGRDDYYNYPRSNDTSAPSSRRLNEEPAYCHDSIVLNKRRSSRRSTYEEEEDYYQPAPIDTRRWSKPTTNARYADEEHYLPQVVPDVKRRSNPIHLEEDYYQHSPTTDTRRIHKQEEEDYYSPISDSSEGKRRSRPIRQVHHEEEEYFQSAPIDTRRRSHMSQQEEEEEYYAPPTSRRRSKQSHKDYYGLGAKMTPFMMEEWEIALDDLCDLYPRLDRHYINDFLRSAQGDFVTAKEMIMEMIMDIR